MLSRNLKTQKCYWRGSEISAEEYASILQIIRTKPSAPNGYEYRLSDQLDWVLYSLPPDGGETEDELSAEDALDIILKGGSD